MNGEKWGALPKLPRPLLNEDNLEFSFSGLKTACLYFLWSEKSKGVAREAIGAEVLRAAVDCLLGKSFRACEKENLGTLVISGGVGSSEYLRREAARRSIDLGIDVIFPKPRYCTDNAAMIALAGMHRFRQKGPDGFDQDCVASMAVGD